MVSLISLLLAVLVVCVIIWGTRSLTRAFAIGEPLSTVIMVVVVLVCLLIVLRQLNIATLF